MLIYHPCRLCAAVAIPAVEIEGADLMLAEGAFEYGAAVHRLGCVISHIFTVVLVPVPVLGIRCATLDQQTLSLTAGGQYLCRRTTHVIETFRPPTKGTRTRVRRS
jgi:hypothetical protein